MGYAAFFTKQGLTPPTGSQSQPQEFNGVDCPNSLSFGRVHGTAPATGSIELDFLTSWSLGNAETITIGGATFIGIVVKGENKVNMQSGATTVISLVDLRDRLHDVNVFFALNMLDDVGRYYHIYPNDWLTQRKKYLFAVDEQEFNDLDDAPLDNVLECGERMISAWSMIKWIADDADFTFSADAIARNILKKSKPDNIDCNQGAKIIDALELILNKCGLQMTFWGNLHMHITLRGFSESAFINQLSVGGAVGICALPNGIDGAIGSELNERGRRALVIGGKNKYQANFCAYPDWNDKFTWKICFNTMNLTDLLTANNLSLQSKMSELPIEWQDSAKWNGGYRNDMKIIDYINEICFKVYYVPPRYPVSSNNFNDDIDPEDEDEFENWVKFNEHARDRNDPEFINAVGFEYPLSSSLITHSDRKFVAWVSFRKPHLMGKFNPFDIDPDDRVPATGCQIDVEEQMNNETCRMQYYVRVIFSEARFIPAKDEQNNGFIDVKPEQPVVELCIDREFFTHAEGEVGNTVRVRELRKSVNQLQSGFLFDEEKPIIAQNFIAAGVQALVKASQIAPYIAKQLLYHEAISSAGNVRFDDTGGYLPDGKVDSITLRFTPENGIEEIINLTTSTLDFERAPVFVQYKVGTSNLRGANFRDEKRITEDIVAQLNAGALKAAALLGKAQAAANKLQHGVNGLFGGEPGMRRTFGSLGNVMVAVGAAIAHSTTFKNGQPIAIKNGQIAAPAQV